MAKRVFVSYAREDSAKVAAVERRLRQLDYVVWLDTDLEGGQWWWDEILQHIQSCDVFVAVISPAGLESRACARERDYAVALGKPILPIAVSPPGQAVPSEFARRQVVDYCVPSEDAAFRLFGALGTLPPAPPLPDPLPPPPDIPLSHLAAVVDSANSPEPLDRAQQLAMVSGLESALCATDQEERDGARRLLDLLGAREDLDADARRVIDRLQLESSQPLDLAQQLALVSRLESALRLGDVEVRADAWRMLERMARRLDLYAEAARRIATVRRDYPP